jgi:hypothetical protein
MGLVLVASGIILLLAQFQGISALSLALKWWPVIFILLGIEVLWHVYSSKEENPKVKYDVFSIMMIFFIVFCGLGVWGLTEVGIMPRLTRMASAQRYQLKTPREEIKLENSVKKIVIEAPRCGLKVRDGGGNSILGMATADITADNRQTAEDFLAGETIASRRVGDIIYLSFNLPLSGGEFGYQARIIDYDLILPGDREVEINGSYPLQVYADRLQNNWLIDGADTEIRVSENADLKIEGLMEDQDCFSGNVDWKITEPPADLGGPYKTRGELVLGSGRYKLNVINSHRLTVNKI